MGDAMDLDGITDDDDNADDVGDSMDNIYRGLSPWELKHIPALEPSATHAVLFNLPLSGDVSQPPRPFRAPAKWDALHVRLPCSVRNQYPVSNPDGTESIKNRWELICDTLDRTIRTAADLEAAILAYNTKYARTWKFRALHQLCADMPPEGREFLFEVTLPGIVRLALQLPELLTAPVPLLKCNRTAAVSFTQLQIASLLANAFLCTFPRRNTQRRGSEYRTFPDINFNRLFHSADPPVIEKLKCLLHYFSRVAAQPPTGVVTIVRRCTTDSATAAPRWAQCVASFGGQRLHVASAGTIEDQGVGLLQVDFANRYLGGGVLGRGCVQEEIRFVICPELMVTKLIAEVLQPDEALFVVGCERFSAYSGYAGTFAFAGEFVDETPPDEWRRRCCAIVAIDALNFQRAEDQYGEELMRRELDKAWAGWAPWLRTPSPAVATGNWGCGAFGGEKRLKALLQLMVCAAAGRPLVYYTFGDAELRRELLAVWRWLVAERLTIAQLWSYLKRFRQQRLPGNKLYPYLYQAHHDATSPDVWPKCAPELRRPELPQAVISTAPPPPVPQTIEDNAQSAFSWPSAHQSKRTPERPASAERSVACADEAAQQQREQTQRPAASTTTPTTTAFVSLLASLDEDYGRSVHKSPSTDDNGSPDDETLQSTSDVGAPSEAHMHSVSSEPSSENIAAGCAELVSNGDGSVSIEGDNDDDVIPATPTPPEVKKRTPHHKRQASIFDYLRKPAADN